MKPFVYAAPTRSLVNILKPEASTIHLLDISWGLSGINRYSAMFPRHYSVGLHSLHVAALLPKRLRLEALLHDAAEAYLGDVPAPVKQLLSEYMALESSMEFVISAKFRLTEDNADWVAVKHADIETRFNEMASMCPHHPRLPANWDPTAHIQPLKRSIVHATFLEMTTRLLAERGGAEEV